MNASFMGMYLMVKDINDTISKKNIQTVEVEKEFFQDLEKVLNKGIREIPRITALFEEITSDNG